MELARVIGQTTATIKHDTLKGCRLKIVEVLDAKGKGGGDPIIVLDSLGSRVGDRVLLTSDSKLIAEMLQADNTPARFAILGLADN
ncbi:Ethanolamine utilization protein EutN/carboxysome [Polystyrenella longa]|uniref:Ethanolamine utilization protein EutN/carboxysome n=1 Tax=Polystyrenella longa TaxID=2528007 RepID=A0A518CI26_9PLAN|nr:EutN/CcmL family microcompartment protein [Polystyrenella longa]QDU78876.1 Ethanolamine utilization protein EutN/carboxysome [Polystyrenella longa]